MSTSDISEAPGEDSRYAWLGSGWRGGGRRRQRFIATGHACLPYTILHHTADLLQQGEVRLARCSAPVARVIL